MAKKAKIELTIETPLPEKKRKAPPSNKHSFAKDNPHRFAPGTSGNPSGRPKNETRLLSKAIRAHLEHRAPDEVASALGLTKGASWAQCISASLMRRAVRGDNNAVSIILNATEPATRNGLNPMGLDGESMGPVPELHISLVQARPELLSRREAPTLDATIE